MKAPPPTPAPKPDPKPHLSFRLVAVRIVLTLIAAWAVVAWMMPEGVATNRLIATLVVVTAVGFLGSVDR